MVLFPTSIITYISNKYCFFFQEKFKDLEDSVEISVSVFFSMKDIPNLLQDPANPKVNAAKRNGPVYFFYNVASV